LIKKQLIKGVTIQAVTPDLKIKTMHRFLFYFVFIIFLGTSHVVGEEKNEPSSTSDMNASANQDQSKNEQSESSKSSIYLQFNTSGLYSSLTDWKLNNRLRDGSIPSTQSFILGSEIGCVINKYVQVGVGYEFFFTTKVTTQQASGNQINSTFFYGLMKAELPLESVPDLSLFVDLDIGSVTATEVLENYQGLDFNSTGSTMGYRIMFGAQYFMIDNWSIMAGGGYLFGKVNRDGKPWPNYSLDLSGFVLRFAVNYHFPL
jgi:opacity protein-like surface antigen